MANGKVREDSGTSKQLLLNFTGSYLMRRRETLNLLLSQRVSADRKLEVLMNFLVWERKLFEHAGWLVLDGAVDTEIFFNATTEARRFLLAMETEFSMLAKV